MRKLCDMKLAKAAQKVEAGIREIRTYMELPMEHGIRIRTNNTLERLNKEIKRRPKLVGAFTFWQIFKK